ncbi:MAG: hypothetical protein WCI73_03460, partial [Phycisphaerae bacterium]
MPTPSEYLPVYVAMPLVLAILLIQMFTLRFYQRHRHPRPEITRKLLHVGMGLVVLPFPWLFTSTWPVIVLAAAAIALLLAARFLPRLRSFHAITAVPRVSLGDVYFPLSVAILFGMAHQTPLLYGIPLLILTFADAVAALIGLTYGRLHYEATAGEKTAEGSLAFFTVAFLAAHIPLLLLTDTGRAETLLIALILGLVVMLAEAIAWHGLDNIFIPLFSYFLLGTYLHLSVHDLLLRLLVTVSLLGLVYLLRHRTTLTPSALLGSVLFGYATWALADWVWLLPPLTLFLLHLAFWPRSNRNNTQHNLNVVIFTAAPGLFWLFLHAHYNLPVLLFPFTTLFAAHLAIVIVSWLPPADLSMRRIICLGGAILAGAAISLLPVFALEIAAGLPPSMVATLRQSLPAFLAANLAGVALAAVLFTWLLPHLVDPLTRQYRYVHHVGGLCAFAGSGLTLAFLRGNVFM